MSFFNETNEDAISVAPDTAATGPRVGFIQSWEVAWNEQVRAAAMYGIEDQMWKADGEQVRAMRKAGIENVPSLSPESHGWFADNMPGPANDVGTYLDVAKFYTDGGDPAFATKLEEYDKRITELNRTYPELRLKTSREMWDGVKAKAQEYERRAQNDRQTWGGVAGAFLGGAVASMNPNTDPLNFITLGVGGAGKSIAQRIGSQTGAQGVIETVNQVTGVQEQRRLLGLDHGFVDAAGRVVSTAIGAGALQGLGEGLAFGYRRWFKNTDTDPAPDAPQEIVQDRELPDTSAVPPQAIPADETVAAAKLTNSPETYVDYIHEQAVLSDTSAGRARTVLDMDYVTTRLDDWGAERPWELPPKTDTAVTAPNSDFIRQDPRVLQRAVERSQVDEMARQVDPDTFRVYDKHAEKKAGYKRQIEEATEGKLTELDNQLKALDGKIYELENKRLNARGGTKSIRKKIKALHGEREALIEKASEGKEPPNVTELRKALMAEDEKMRDLAPAVSRAYARARQKWDNTAEGRKAVLEAMREGRPNVRFDEETELPGFTEATLADRAPILRDRAKVEERLTGNEDAADVAAAILAENSKALDDALTQYRNALDSVLKETEDGEIEIQGQSYRLSLDKDTVFVPNEEGTGAVEMTVREVLEDNRMKEQELEAVTSCSIL